jgi:hypothetical protein
MREASMTFHRPAKTRLLCLVALLLFVTGCRVLYLMGLAQPRSTPPDEPGEATPYGWPVLVLVASDTMLTVGDTATLRGDLYVSPVTPYSKPYAVYSDTSRRVVSAIASVVAVSDSTVITALTPGVAKVTMSGYQGPYPISAYVNIHVSAKH